MKRVVLLVSALALLIPTIASAQDDESHWGVAVSVKPKWKAADNLKALWDAEQAIDIESSDFSIGVARGKTLGGDWNLNFIRKNFKDGSTVDNTELQCDFGPGVPCLRFGEFKTLRNVKLTGIEAVKFIKFANIKDRVQIGLNVGGGFGTLQGDVDVVKFDVNQACNNRGCTFTPTQQSFTVDADGEICDGSDDECDNALFVLSRFPLGKVELAVGAIVAPGLKIRVAGGFDFPGQNVFNLTGIYLFGAN
jgi:hypothetical protein